MVDTEERAKITWIDGTVEVFGQSPVWKVFVPFVYLSFSLFFTSNFTSYYRKSISSKALIEESPLAE